MKGNVIAVNHKKVFVAVRLNSGITIIELLSGDNVEVDDVVSGNLESLGGETLFNESRQEEIDAFIQEIQCSQPAIRMYFD